MPIDSEALRVNTPHTAENVVIPPEFQTILDSVAELTGVHSALKGILTEYFHPYRNLDTVVSDLGTLQLRYWTYLARHPEHGTLFDVVATLVTRLLAADLSHPQLSSLLRSTFSWCRDVAKSAAGPDCSTSMGQLMTTIRGLLAQSPDAFLERDIELRELVQVAGWAGPAADAAAELYRQVVLSGYQRLVRSLDLPAWVHVSEGQLTDPAGVGELFGYLSGAQMQQRIATLKAASLDELRSPQVHNYSNIIAQTLSLLPKLAHPEDRFAVDLFLLKDDALGYRQEQALNDLLFVVKQLVKPENKMDTEVVLARLTDFFKDRNEEFLLMRLHCYEAVGCAIGKAGYERAADRLITDILSWEFQYPEIVGATDDWETLVNPYHLPKIRCWMHIIESNPGLFERLAAALNVQLRLGGVHIADTDLFQRDVTEFLNADIGPIYFVAKQLLRVFPVYFAEVGAEGELRASSTHFDEVTMRHDTLLHFLRKQVHAESSNRLVAFSAEVVRYWITLDVAGITPYVSDNTLAAVINERHFAQGPHLLLQRLQQERGIAEVDAFLAELLDDDTAALQSQLAEWASTENDAVRVAQVIRTHQLLKRKYTLTSDDTIAEVRNFHGISQPVREMFLTRAAQWQADPNGISRDGLLDAALDVLAELKSIILDPTPTVADERLYHKRHIAAGIPSIYGSYREPKFDAMGLSFRVESLVSGLLDDIVAEGVEPYVTRDTLRRMVRQMQRFNRAIQIDGVSSDNFTVVLDMLQASFSFYSFTFHQYLNAFQMLARAVSDLSSRSVRSHGQILRQILATDKRPCVQRGLEPEAIEEIVIREVLVSGLGIQTLDRYVGQNLHKISRLNDKLGGQALTKMMNYDPPNLIWPLSESAEKPGDLATLGFKGYGLRQMAAAGLRVPEGFVISTELFHVKSAMSYQRLFDDTENRVRAALTELEQQTGLKLGDPDRPLLLSVRSGSPISMPGLMTTFVNVGLNEENTAALAQREGFAWAAWDSLRRSIQTWAMSFGVGRDVFHQIMLEAKARFGVESKQDFAPEQMREIALAYKQAATDHGVALIEDPFQQVMACIWRVVESWDGPDPVLFRHQTSVAENWGTAVICQRMVFGNLSQESGSGVVFTNNPLEPFSHQVRLFGDFTVASQGEDLVGGLVFPLPVSENQREGSALYEGTTDSLETLFPELYDELLAVGRRLASGPGSDPQEIEFTFESPRREDLYILQKRAVVPEQQANAPYFDTAEPDLATPTAVAMGVSGGAYVGRVAFDGEDVDELVAQGDPVILVRPDTVPEDLALIAKVAGVLTGRGGATSHAAVTAKRLAKTAVVGCHSLLISPQQATIAGQPVAKGDWLSIDGRTGNIYLGKQPIATKPGRR